MQPRGALFLSLMVTDCSGERSFSTIKKLKMNWIVAMFQDRLSKVTNLGKQIVMNS